MFTENPPVHVLHTRVVTGTGGGPEKTLMNSGRYLRDYNIRTTCLFMHPPGDTGFQTLQRRAAAAGAEIVGIPDKGPLDLSVIRAAINFCRKYQVTVWHGHDYKSNALGLIVRLFHPMQLVTTAHGWVRFTPRTPLYYAIDRFSMRFYRRIICVSRDLAEACRRSWIRPKKISVIDNAIVEEDYDPAPARVEEKNRFGFTASQFLIGAVGRLSEEKGFHHLLEAVGRLVRDGHSVGLLIAGEGHLRETLQRRIEELDLQSHVRLTGYLEDPRSLYRAIDLYALSSLREGLPNVVLEAMAGGRAVVATRCNGVPDLVRHEQNGLIVEPDDPESLYRGLQRCLLNTEMVEKYAIEGRRTIEESFSFRQRMKKIVDIYRSLSPALADRIPSQPAAAAEESDEHRALEPAAVETSSTFGQS